MKNETLEQFKRNQKRNQEILKKLLDFVHTGEEYGIKVEESLKDKIRNAIKDVSGQKLKVALVGGFSEGKTSIAAAWIERLDKESMNIDHQESSDEVQIYHIDNEMELVDTPGLFGFKEKITDSSKIERYKDITKKYISEAHLILYALNPSNPIKESHKDDLNWLFRTLNLLSRTIFVISRFDEEADIEDEEDYNKRFKIKKENIQNRLNDLISLSEKEKESLIIVAVAANPFDLGVEHWLKHQEEFQKLSHIKALQDATQKKIKENGGKLTIIEETKKASFKMWSIGKCRPQNKRCKILIEKWNI
ncbi:50S ribosome-binding GTPase [Helicobacter pylori]|nr:50S ribosome-binding GTPase [Helicobacter pylori]